MKNELEKTRIQTLIIDNKLTTQEDVDHYDKQAGSIQGGHNTSIGMMHLNDLGQKNDCKYCYKDNENYVKMLMRRVLSDKYRITQEQFQCHRVEI